MSKLQPDWRQIAGFAIQEDGSMGIVWLTHDTEWDVVRVHHAVAFKRAVLAVVAGELNRKPWIPVAWENKEFCDTLLNDYRCNMLRDRSLDTPAAAERLTNEIWERMETGRFKISPTSDEYIHEQKGYNRLQAKLPRQTHPLMAATRHAIDQLPYARTEKSTGKTKIMYPKVSIA